MAAIAMPGHSIDRLFRNAPVIPYGEEQFPVELTIDTRGGAGFIDIGHDTRDMSDPE